MFFCLPNTVEPAGLFSRGHLCLFLITLAAIAAGLFASRHLTEAGVRVVIRAVTALLWLLEAGKILFVLLRTGSRNPNDFVPLYYCSLILYAGVCSSLGRGRLRRLGDVFIATGGLVGGICFLIVPNTSLTRYPVFHVISLHSFLLHGLMVYLGLLCLVRIGSTLRGRDILYCALPVSAVSAAALLFNTIWDAAHPAAPVANLMFLSKDFPGTPVSILYHLSPTLFPVLMWLVQALIPYLAVWGAVRLVLRVRQRGTANEEIPT